MHKIVLDTNVIISALISHGYPYRILHNLVATERIKICLSEPVLNEYAEVLIRTKFSQYKDFKQNALFIMTNIKRVGKFYKPNIHLDIITDKADNKFLELSVFSKADFLITGNTNHFTISDYEGVKIISPKDYIENFWKV
ncbi:MAG: putative toxin-antitoxin system toxin component, PIN family [Bacteroidetes bacterium GWA2_32_17]|nr:MAG: putative toxin-antitoxin system toxin component, PIN family [Bacteroidetes bacterium GWA2_32_17]